MANLDPKLPPPAETIVNAITGALPNVPRSSVEAVVSAYEQLRAAAAPDLSDAPLTDVLQLIASTGLVLKTPGGAEGSLSRIGDQGALSIVNKLQQRGIRFMSAPPF